MERFSSELGLEIRSGLVLVSGLRSSETDFGSILGFSMNFVASAGGLPFLRDGL